ncbi:TonB-dependent receptor (plasmid) [Cereibacter azotoformans]|uniref:TonB-dependent receptor family protein n=1 Tax=Cereibacter azotoformans TaxID=43057 RepID=UPI001EECD9A2|nr:TonB-dependent receptor [Cereibacter azotoformans]ULB12418.1 TonB-dependent receptor [Cereibacter azotoformans]
MKKRMGPLALILATAASPALAQSAGPGADIELAPIVVEALDAAAARLEELRARIFAAPGGASVVAAPTTPAPTLAEALTALPGSIVQEFFGGNDQPRIQIRGSGLQQNPTERGLLVMQDGMPVNRADGAYVVGLAAPGQAEALEVWRGAAANRLGAAQLGGAINLISPSAATVPGTKLTAGAGSFGRKSLSGSTAFDGVRADGLLRLELTDGDGFREANNASRRAVLGGTLDFATGAASTRLFFTATDLGFEIPGPVTAEALENDSSSVHAGPVIVGGVPTSPGPNVPRDQPYRETTQLLAGGRTTIDLGRHLWDFGLSASRTEDRFAFPISAGIRDTDSLDGTLSARYALRGEGPLPLFEATARWSLGTADRSYFHNLGDEAGSQFGENQLDSSTLALHAGANLSLAPNLTLSPGLGFTHATRDNDDLWAAATRPTVGYNPMMPDVRLPNGAVPSVATDYARSYSGWSPSLALTWQPAEDQTLWASVSRSFEPPTQDDLLATVNGTPNTGPGRPTPVTAGAMFATPDLEAQVAETLEIGSRGTRGGIAWDVTAYHSRIENEILSLRDLTGATLASVNADRTRHSGLEAGLLAELAPGLAGRLAWTWQDFRFEDDPTHGDNRLAGAPKTVVSATLGWEATPDLTLTGVLKWVDDVPVDNANTVWAESYLLADLRGEYRLNERLSLLAEITNLTDEHYAASTLTVDTAAAGQAAFLPGEGRAVYFGARMNF